MVYRLLTMLCTVLLSAGLTNSILQAEESPMAKEMSALGEAFGGLKVISKGSIPENALELVQKAQMAVLKAKPMIPPYGQPGKAPEGKTEADMIKSYRKFMAQTLEALAQLEIAILDKDVDKAAELYKHLRGLKSAGHSEHQ